MRKVYGDIGLDPARTTFVECHGTGTPVGDPIEAAAVGQVSGSKGVYIGSIKPNLDHSEGASGISSLLKSIVMLEKSTIVPNIKFRSPNPKIDFERYRLQVPQELFLGQETVISECLSTHSALAAAMRISSSNTHTPISPA